MARIRTAGPQHALCGVETVIEVVSVFCRHRLPHGSRSRRLVRVDAQCGGENASAMVWPGVTATIVQVVELAGLRCGDERGGRSYPQGMTTRSCGLMMAPNADPNRSSFAWPTRTFTPKKKYRYPNMNAK